MQLRIPRGPLVRTLRFHCGGRGSIPGWGTRIPQATARPKKKKKGGGHVVILSLGGPLVSSLLWSGRAHALGKGGNLGLVRYPVCCPAAFTPPLWSLSRCGIVHLPSTEWVGTAIAALSSLLMGAQKSSVERISCTSDTTHARSTI